jgi:hypothetical protein
VIGGLDLAAAEEWIRSAVQPVGDLVLERARAWATIVRVPLADGQAWFKACAPVQAFEPRLTAELAGRWPDRVVRVLAHDPERAWLLTADAGEPVASTGNPPENWLRALPLYAELQIGEIEHVGSHLEHGVQDLRIETLPRRYDELVRRDDLPVEPDEMARLRRFAPRLAGLCDRLTAEHPVHSIQHDDLHHRSLFQDGTALRILDWGDASIGHPFASLVVTFRFLEEFNGLSPTDSWFERLRDAYLEPWGPGLAGTFDLAMRLGMMAQLCAWLRHRDAMDEEARRAFDQQFAIVLRRALARAVDRVI